MKINVGCFFECTFFGISYVFFSDLYQRYILQNVSSKWEALALFHQDGRKELTPSYLDLRKLPADNCSNENCSKRKLIKKVVIKDEKLFLIRRSNSPHPHPHIFTITPSPSIYDSSNFHSSNFRFPVLFLTSWYGLYNNLFSLP